MRKDSKFVDMIIAFVVLGLSAVLFLVLLINYEIEKPNLPTPTPILTATPSPTPSSTPTPTPGYSKTGWNKLFELEETTTYTYTEVKTDSDGKPLKTVYKIADGAIYAFTQTAEKTASEGWNYSVEDKYYFVTGALALNKNGEFAVDKKGYKSAEAERDEFLAKNRAIIKIVKDKIDDFHQEIAFNRYQPVEVYKLYQTMEEDKVKSTITIEDGKIKSIFVEYLDDSKPDKPVTVAITIEFNSVTGAEIIDSCPKK